MQIEITLGYGPGAKLDRRFLPVPKPWTHDEWVSYLDGWAFEALGLARPAQRHGTHEAHFAFGQLEYRKAKDAKEAAS